MFLKIIENFLKYKEKRTILQKIIRAKYNIYNILKNFDIIEKNLKEIILETDKDSVKIKAEICLEEIRKIKKEGSV
jgi:hypothetical protein